MTKHCQLLEFEQGTIVGARQKGHSISEFVSASVILHATTKTSGSQEIFNNHDQRYLESNVCYNRQATLVQIITPFNTEGSKPISSSLFNVLQLP